MFLINLLHFYQPHNQQDDILNRIVHESYLPIVEGMLARPNAKAIFNISGVLLELLDSKGYTQVIDGFKQLVANGQVELTGSAMYHAFLPLLPEDEIERQITLNEEVYKKYFGKYSRCSGFFSPEMAVNSKVFEVARRLGYEWVAAPQVAYRGNLVADKLFKEDSTGLNVFFRNKRVSSLILSAVARNAATLVKETQDLFNSDKYWFTVMDAETFGHHRIGHDKFLMQLFDHSQLECTTAKPVLSMPLDEEVVVIRPSTWTNEEQDFWVDKEQTQETESKSFILWQDPTNPIHKLQWAFVMHVLRLLETYADKDTPEWHEARAKMDKAIASDQFWWASAKPWWSLEMIEQGAYALKDVVNTLDLASEEINKAEDYYRKILDQAFEWQRTGYIRKRHLENSATFMKQPFKDRTPAEWYNQMVLEFEDEIKKAAEKMEFEKCVKWRDALLKLKQGSDIYDVLHVVDELWSARQIPSVKPFLQHDWSEFSDFAKEHFLGVEDEEGFEEWQRDND